MMISPVALFFVALAGLVISSILIAKAKSGLQFPGSPFYPLKPFDYFTARLMQICSILIMGITILTLILSHK